ncbi:MAG: hypothetical protein CMJ18_06390 [Phycisphaeraceae bacterium]|nr:hypothetical protein [Phycisphaeraceae bacterium]
MASTVTSVAVIIARAGSKGLSNKNIREVLGRPMVAWTVEHALGSRRVDQVVVTSDCPEVLRIADEYGVTACRRPPERATDTTTIDDGARHGIECWEREHGGRCHYVAILYANIPVRPRDLTDRALTKLIETEADSVQSVYPVGKMHPLWMKRLSGPFDDVLEMYEPNRIYRRQDLPPVYMLDGGVLAVTRDGLFNVDPAEPHAFLGSDRRAIVCPAGHVIDVDDDLDLTLAEVILTRQRKGIGH